MTKQSWAGLLHEVVPADGSAYASSTTATDVGPQAGSILIPPYTSLGGFVTGQTVRVFARGKFSNTGTPTLKIGLYYGGAAGTKLAESGAITTITAATAWAWRAEFDITVRLAGGASTGSLFTTGTLMMPASLTQFQDMYVLDAAAAAAVTVDMSTAKALSIVATWGTNSASNTLTCHQMYALGLN